MKNLISAFMLSFCVLLVSFNSSAAQCGFVKPPNYEQGKAIGGAGKEEAVKKGHEDTKNPLGVLKTCVFATVSAGMNPKTVISEGGCACLNAVKQFCKISKGFLKPKNGASLSLCIPLAPVVFGSFKL